MSKRQSHTPHQLGAVGHQSVACQPPKKHKEEERGGVVNWLTACSEFPNSVARVEDTRKVLELALLTLTEETTVESGPVQILVAGWGSRIFHQEIKKTVSKQFAKR